MRKQPKQVRELLKSIRQDLPDGVILSLDPKAKKHLRICLNTIDGHSAIITAGFTPSNPRSYQNTKADTLRCARKLLTLSSIQKGQKYD